MKIVFVLEVVVRRGFGHAGGFGDLLHRDIVVATLEKKLAGDIEQGIFLDCSGLVFILVAFVE